VTPSIQENETMTERRARPEFATSIRGYDRLQVDEYIDRLHDIASDAEDRARVAESELEFSRHTTVGPRVAQILDLAVEEGKELRERVRVEADRARAEAQTEAEAIAAGARESAELTRTEAERARQEILADADARRREVLGEVERLTESKTRLLGDLGRLQRLLSEATGIEPDFAGDAAAGDDVFEGVGDPVAVGARAGDGRRNGEAQLAGSAEQ
jgi:cell division septum initiation protein DivIVA